MDPATALMASTAISSGTNFLGGLLGRSQQDKLYEDQKRLAEQNRRDQMWLAENSIKIKVRDAQEAGIHPLYALGAQPLNFSPVSVGSPGPDPMSTALSSMGQDISRAVSAYAGPSARAKAVTEVAAQQEVTANNLKLENMDLQNKILRSKLVTMNQPGTPPGIEFPVPENKKVEERPPLMGFGSRWLTNPNTSPMKAYEDQYGDDGPVSWVLPPLIAANDAIYNLRKSAPMQDFGRALRSWPSYRWAMENTGKMYERLYGRR